MFQGATALNLDAKGRLAVPTRHRDALQSGGASKQVLTAHPQKPSCRKPDWPELTFRTLQSSLLPFVKRASGILGSFGCSLKDTRRSNL